MEFSYPCPPEPGTILVTCELEAPPDDVLAGDNAASVLVETVEPAGVLLVDGSGASDAAVADVVAGKARARGRLPFDLPRSPVTTASRTAGDQPLYPHGAGLGAAPGD